MSFELVIAADWSAAATPTGRRPRKDAIWVCADRAGSRELRYFPTRAAALDWIGALLAEGQRTLLGFDFAMGFPPGFAAALTGEARALAVWDWLAVHVTDAADNANNRFELAQVINRRFPGTGPFWGRPAALDLPDLPATDRARAAHGMAERRQVEARARNAKPVWQLAYAGAVGSQTLLGMAALSRLRRAHPDLAVWPQETGFARPEARIVLAEIYPSLFDDNAQDHAIKDARQVMAASAALRAAPGEWWTAPAALPDAARIASEEGWILGVGPDGPLPVGRAPDDCFALPPGIDWTPVDAALATLREGTAPVTGVEVVPVERAAGRILAADAVARRANPPAANAAVDGWGFSHATLGPGPIPVAPGRAAAGQPHVDPVPPGRALRILTGAALPPGVDTVALQEDAVEAAGAVTLRAIPKPGANTRRAGEDLASGDVLLRQGAVLRPSDLALAIAGGLAALELRALLRVGVLSTGDEIVAPGGEGIADVNRPMLLAMLAGWGLAPVDLGRVRDDPAALAARLDAADVDALLTSGGASAGAEDHLSRLMRARGTVQHWRIAVKPGRPLMLGRWNGVPLFGLPGNPVAAFTCAALFARPALLRLAGADWSDPPRRRVPAGFAKRKKAGRREYLRARIRDGRAEIFASEGSGRVSGLSWAEGFVELPDAALEIAEGDAVDYIAFADLGIG
ncbi:molybdopterin-binding protein [Jannaschia ovalis]|uniref:Molybdopterin molybdenumtransferase n=1 Tax=Jannaschia ovalis TaxID=3038773 RepID=A0ABY8LHE8_9RHOB|nr:molybdopterin-binding protein [Jannaschia sp. GRR-S6-38]WGH79785.1 molybdopterin-binding protein [Jannaschia sp. GRR-S6-38]